MFYIFPSGSLNSLNYLEGHFGNLFGDSKRLHQNMISLRCFSAPILVNPTSPRTSIQLIYHLEKRRERTSPFYYKLVILSSHEIYHPRFINFNCQCLGFESVSLFFAEFSSNIRGRRRNFYSRTNKRYLTSSWLIVLFDHGDLNGIRPNTCLEDGFGAQRCH